MADIKKYTGPIASGIFLGTISAGFLIRSLLQLLSEQRIMLYASALCAFISVMIYHFTRYSSIQERYGQVEQKELIPSELSRSKQSGSL